MESILPTSLTKSKLIVAWSLYWVWRAVTLEAWETRLFLLYIRRIIIYRQIFLIINIYTFMPAVIHSMRSMWVMPVWREFVLWLPLSRRREGTFVLMRLWEHRAFKWYIQWSSSQTRRSFLKTGNTMISCSQLISTYPLISMWSKNQDAQLARTMERMYPLDLVVLLAIGRTCLSSPFQSGSSHHCLGLDISNHPQLSSGSSTSAILIQRPPTNFIFCKKDYSLTDCLPWAMRYSPLSMVKTS